MLSMTHPRKLARTLVALYALFVLARGVWRGRRAAHARPTVRTAEPQTWPFVSVIIPAWRDRAALEACLDSLARVDYPQYEVIVVAGGPDGTFDAARAAARRDARILVVEQLPAGKNAALNQGLAVARADTLVLLDADSVLSPQWLKALVAALRDDVAASTGNYVPLCETPVSLYGDLMKVHEYQVRDAVILQGSGGIAVRRAALDAIGSFPEERVSSDWDLDARLALHGYRRVFAAQALIRSHRPAGLREWWRNELRWRRLHLRSLFRLKGDLLADPLPAARRLYPYVTAWAVLLSGGAAGLSLLTRSPRLKQAALTAAGATASLLLTREMGPVVSVMAFQPSRRWLPVIPAAPVLTVMTWAACCVASVTRSRAALQFKGVRHMPDR